MLEFREETVACLVEAGVLSSPMDGNHGEIHPKGSDFLEQGTPFIVAADINGSRIDLTNCKFIDPNQASGLRKGRALEGDVLLTHKGTIGRTAIVPGIQYDYLMLTPQVTYYRIIDLDVLNNIYLKYYFDTARFQSILGKFAGAGSTRAYLGITGQQYLPIRFPDIENQRNIAVILAGLDKKIELNQRINAELEALAKTIYDYWFVQFDFPDENGRPYKSSGGAMVWSDVLKRAIPAQWGVVSLYDIAKYSNGLAMQKYRPLSDEYLPVIKIKEMSGGFSAETEKARLDIPSKAIVDDGDVLFSWSATLAVQIWSGGRGALNQHIFKVTSKSYPRSYLFFALSNYLNHFRMMADRRKTTMGHITKDHLKQAMICLPPKDKISEFDRLVGPCLKQQLTLKMENRHLIELRDWLLPMLMNGQVRVK